MWDNSGDGRFSGLAREVKKNTLRIETVGGNTGRERKY
jgi:hypothetical protein